MHFSLQKKKATDSTDSTDLIRSIRAIRGFLYRSSFDLLLSCSAGTDTSRRALAMYLVTGGAGFIGSHLVDRTI
jgi:hypothetical protein